MIPKYHHSAPLIQLNLIAVSGCANECYTNVWYGGPQLSHRIPETHTEFKPPHQIQIIQTEFKSLTPNSNHSHRIQVTHTEFK